MQSDPMTIGATAVMRRLIERAAAASSGEALAQPELQTAECDEHGLFRVAELGDDGVMRFFAGGCPACKAQRRVEQAMARAAIAPRFASCTFETYLCETDEQRAVADECRRYADDFAAVLKAGRSMILHGTPGTGKNHLAVAITRVVMARGYTALHTTAFDLVRAIRATWGSASDEANLRRTLANIDLLCLDEVGRTAGSDGERVELFAVLNARYLGLKPTLLMSNGQPREIEAFLGKALYDRMGENGGLRLAMDWPSMRRRASDFAGDE